MKKCILLLLLCLNFTSMGNETISEATKSKSDYVYICTGPKATAYHRTPDCKGLNKCSGNVVKVSRSKAKHRSPCKICKP